ncbi:TetR/AcrR family transcriptional regulator [Curtobacterium herbarum]|uniref:TetR/AcrR family transcriptional regulator n=1 Tax=Curtobacterium herbarum TaxID=150122 RepID=UPI001C8D0629|nr:TetR/AcrR family transcriptional regulator [Curtobacterium herbarum]MBY0175299.1 TetR/AcrR family transcriptional regulator [Curtobacterium herbarum]
MSSPAIPLGRREMLKARSRRAILDAAIALVVERGGPAFTVEELAERADMSRATVFNYFPSVSDVLVTASVEQFETAWATFDEVSAAAPGTDGSRAAVFDEVSRSLRATSMPDVIVSVGAVVGRGDEASPRHEALLRQVMDRTSLHLAEHVSTRYPSWSRLEVDLLVGSLMSGVTVASSHWLLNEGGDLSAESRATWARMLDSAIEGSRTGYGQNNRPT